MSKPAILCVDDQREVLSAIRRELQSLGTDYEIVECESAKEAEEVLNELNTTGQETKLIICDHIMPGENGIDFLARLNTDDRFRKLKRIVLTGLASQQDTIKAINKAKIDYYLEKPWDSAEFIAAVKTLLK